ncbi:type II toxin-antitoxin system HicA family toxin [Paenibacillus vini]|uniref:type II toxin-antitoxin system HicA family toxin n=1 Tax=Paenibacillus vini TaxID=1476024 RepID=UPI0025B70FDF|nr:type II toxin-antitoxin system HicA family toxin [Paenibacillus vini]MDN4069283.1 type II toxin-antitoxin system HicA family toxin [Paenibacillus vini]MDN4069336.1 type II toxin-antitoxin system HicA family toxin [Paenibacillus vini]
MGKQRTVREVIKALKKAGFIESPNHGKGTSHRRYINPNDPSKFADIAVHSMGDTLAKGTLKSIERQSGVEF